MSGDRSRMRERAHLLLQAAEREQDLHARALRGLDTTAAGPATGLDSGLEAIAHSAEAGIVSAHQALLAARTAGNRAMAQDPELARLYGLIDGGAAQPEERIVEGEVIREAVARPALPGPGKVG